jgi:hypothetical protein
MLAFAAGLAITSALAPLEYRLQVFVSSVFFSLFLLRSATYIDTIIRNELTFDDNAGVVAYAFAIHWAILALVAVWWPSISERVGREVTLASGRDADVR